MACIRKPREKIWESVIKTLPDSNIRVPKVGGFAANFVCGLFEFCRSRSRFLIVVSRGFRTHTTSSFLRQYRVRPVVRMSVTIALVCFNETMLAKVTFQQKKPKRRVVLQNSFHGTFRKADANLCELTRERRQSIHYFAQSSHG